MDEQIDQLFHQAVSVGLRPADIENEVFNAIYLWYVTTFDALAVAERSQETEKEEEASLAQMLDQVRETTKGGLYSQLVILLTYRTTAEVEQILLRKLYAKRTKDSRPV